MARPRRRDVSPEQFDLLVQQALAELPVPYARLAQEVSVVVEEEPPPDVLEDLELDSADDLLGLYQGLPVTAESFFIRAGSSPRASPFIADRFYVSAKPPKTSGAKSGTRWSMNWATMSGSAMMTCRISSPTNKSDAYTNSARRRFASMR